MSLPDLNSSHFKTKSAYSGNLKTQLCRFSFPLESAYQGASELRELGVTQFIDSSEGKFNEEIKRCDGNAEIIESIEFQIRKEGYEIPQFAEKVGASHQKEIDEIRGKLKCISDEFCQIQKNINDLLKNERRLLDLKTILETIPKYGMTQNFNGKLKPEEQLDFLTGIIKSRKKTDFETFTRRMSRAQVFLKLFPIQTDAREVDRKVFVLFFSGEDQKAKVQKICDGFHSKCYTIPENSDNREEFLARIIRQADQIKSIIKKTSDYRTKIMKSTGKILMRWKSMNQKFKEELLILNKFSIDKSSNRLIGKCWIPGIKIKQIHLFLRSENSDIVVSPVVEIVEKISVEKL